jgi:hypothetical protein
MAALCSGQGITVCRGGDAFVLLGFALLPRGRDDRSRVIAWERNP